MNARACEKRSHDSPIDRILFLSFVSFPRPAAARLRRALRFVVQQATERNTVNMSIAIWSNGQPPKASDVMSAFSVVVVPLLFD